MFELSSKKVLELSLQSSVLIFLASSGLFFFWGGWWFVSDILVFGVFFFCFVLWNLEYLAPGNLLDFILFNNI